MAKSSAKPPVRVAIIGAGAVSDYHHVPALGLDPRAQLVAACDLAIAADTAGFGFPEPRVGLAALGGGGLQRLARTLPLKLAMDIVLTGRRLSAAEAKSFALINDAVPVEDLRARTLEVAMQIVEGAPLSIIAAKQVILQSLAMPDLATALHATYQAADQCFASEDAKEGQPLGPPETRPDGEGDPPRGEEDIHAGVNAVATEKAAEALYGGDVSRRLLGVGEKDPAGRHLVISHDR